MKRRIIWAALVFIVIASVAPAAGAQGIEIPAGCTQSFTDVGVPMGATVQVWAMGEETAHTYNVQAPAGAYVLIVDKHPTVAAVVIVDGHEVNEDRTVIRLTRPGIIHILAGAELTWQDEPGTCYGFQWSILPLIRATRRRSA